MSEQPIKGWWLAGAGGVALAAVLGLTREHWLPAAPQALLGQPAPAAAPAPQVPSAAAATSATGGTTETSTAAAAQASQPAAAPSAPSQAVASAEPPPATEAPQAPAAPSFDTVRVEKTGEAVIAGRAAPGSAVAIKLGDKVVGTAVAGQDGTFVVIPDKPLPSGTGMLSLEAKAPGATVATAGDQTVAVMVPEQAKSTPLVAVVSATAPTKVLQSPEPAAPAPAATPVKSAGLSLDAVDYDAAGNIVFSGRFAPGATARVYVDNAPAGEARAGDDGHWSFAGGKIAAGVHQLRVDGLDAKGAVTARIEAPFFRESSEKLASAATSDAGGTQAPAATTPASTAQPAPAPATASATPAAAPEAAGPKNGRVIIQPGNNLWTIATVIYGEGTKYTVLYGANKDLIRNPDLIYPGQIFTTPDVVPPEQIDPKLHKPLQPAPASSN